MKVRYLANSVLAGDTWTRPDGARFRVLKANLRRTPEGNYVMRVLLHGLDGSTHKQEWWETWPQDRPVDIKKPPQLFRE